MRLITAAKLAKQDPGRLDKAFMDLNNAIQALLNAIDMATPGAQEIHDALREIQNALARYGHRSDPTYTLPPQRPAGVARATARATSRPLGRC